MNNTIINKQNGFKFNTKLLYNELNNIKTAKDKKAVQHVQIESKKNYSSKLYSYNLYDSDVITINKRIDSLECIEPRNFNLDFYELFDIANNAKNMSDSEIFQDTGLTGFVYADENNDCIINLDYMNFKIDLLEDNLPKIDNINYTNEFTINLEGVAEVKQFINYLVNTKKYTAKLNREIAQIKGIDFDIRDGKLYLVAIDGFRISKTELDVDVDSNKNFNFILFPKGIDSLVKILRTNQKNVTGITFKSNDSNDIEACIHLKDAQDNITISIQTYKVSNTIFFDYLSIMKTNKLDKDVVLNTKKLLNCCNLIKNYYSKHADVKRLDLMVIEAKNGNLTISDSEKQVTGSFKTDVKDFKIGLDVKYVIDVLKEISEKDVTLKIGDSIGPVEIMENNREYLILPIRLNY